MRVSDTLLFSCSSKYNHPQSDSIRKKLDTCRAVVDDYVVVVTIRCSVESEAWTRSNRTYELISRVCP
jgi:hypothetical protein